MTSTRDSFLQRHEQAELVKYCDVLSDKPVPYFPGVGGQGEVIPTSLRPTQVGVGEGRRSNGEKTKPDNLALCVDFDGRVDVWRKVLVDRGLWIRKWFVTLCLYVWLIYKVY